MSHRLGIVGAGSISAFHAEGAVSAGATIVGVCDPDRARAEARAAAHPGARATDDLDELLALPEIDAVVVCAPNHLHRPLALAALAAGKDLLLEKPMATSVAECDEIIEAAGRSGRAVQLGFVSRYAPAAVAAREVVASGALGTVHHVRASQCRARGVPGLGRWFTSKALAGGGALIDIGVHLVDLGLDLIGRPAVERVSCACTCAFAAPIERYAFTEMWAGPPDPDGTCDVEDGATALLRLAGGATMALDVRWASNAPAGTVGDGLLLLGDRGGLWLETWAGRVVLATETGGVLADAAPHVEPGDSWTIAWRRQHELFRDAIATRTEPPATMAHGRAVQAIIEALYASDAARAEVAVER